MVGKNIKKIRTKKNFTLRGLAEKAKISKSTLSDIENENTNPTITTLTKIADALEVPLDYLTRKSTMAVIEDRLEEMNMTFEELLNKTNISIEFFNTLDDIIPDEYGYNNLKLIANTLGIDSAILARALYRQEPPAYDGHAISAEDEFDSVEDISLNTDQIQLLNDFDKLNYTGKLKAKERVYELTLVPDYSEIAENLKIEILAAHNDKVSAEANARNIEKIKSKYKEMHNK